MCPSLLHISFLYSNHLSLNSILNLFLEKLQFFIVHNFICTHNNTSCIMLNESTVNFHMNTNLSLVCTKSFVLYGVRFNPLSLSWLQINITFFPSASQYQSCICSRFLHISNVLLIFPLIDKIESHVINGNSRKRMYRSRTEIYYIFLFQRVNPLTVLR